MEDGLVNLAAIVGALVAAQIVIPCLMFLNSRGATTEPPVEEQFAWKDEDDI